MPNPWWLDSTAHDHADFSGISAADPAAALLRRLMV
jgi:hypothetical protein